MVFCIMVTITAAIMIPILFCFVLFDYRKKVKIDANAFSIRVAE